MMNHGLPQIVNSRHTLTDDIRKIDKVEVEELTRLWKVYTTNKNVIQTGLRLENLFWRIWGSDRIQQNISGTTVAKIFLMIDRGEEAIANDAYKIPPQRKPVIKHVPVDISVPPTPPPSPYSRDPQFSPSNNVLFQPSQTALSASLLQAYPNTPPSPQMPPRVPPPSPAVGDLSLMHRPTLTRVHRSYPESANDEQIQIGREMSRKSASSASSGRSRKKHPQGILRTSKTGGRKRLGPIAMSRTTSNSSNATQASDASTPTTEPQDASASGRETDHTSNSMASGQSMGSSQKGSENGSAQNKGDWLVEPDFRAKYLEQRKKERISAFAGSSMVKGPLKTSATTATVSTIAVSVPKTKRGRGRSIVVVDSIAPLKSADDDDEPLRKPAVENAYVSISELLPGVPEQGSFDKAPAFQRTKSQLSMMIEQARRGSDGGDSPSATFNDKAPSRRSSPPPVIHEHEDQGGDWEEDEESDQPLEMKRPTSKKSSKPSRRPKLRSKKSQ